MRIRNLDTNKSQTSRYTNVNGVMYSRNNLDGLQKKEWIKHKTQETDIFHRIRSQKNAVSKRYQKFKKTSKLKMKPLYKEAGRHSIV